MEGSGHGQQLAVNAQTPLTTLRRPEQEHTDRMVEQQISGLLSQDVCRLLRQQGIRNGEGEVRHGELRTTQILAVGARRLIAEPVSHLKDDLPHSAWP